MAEEFRTPQSANEALLQNILGAENEIREPQSVTEYYLKKIWEQGQSGGALYRHDIFCGISYGDISHGIKATIINNKSESYQSRKLAEVLYENGYKSGNSLTFEHHSIVTGEQALYYVKASPTSILSDGQYILSNPTAYAYKVTPQGGELVSKGSINGIVDTDTVTQIN